MDQQVFLRNLSVAISGIVPDGNRDGEGRTGAVLRRTGGFDFGAEFMAEPVLRTDCENLFEKVKKPESQVYYIKNVFV